MRAPMKLNRITVLAFNEFKRIKYDGQDISVSNGYLLNSAYEMIIPKLKKIIWTEVNRVPIPNVTDNKDTNITKRNSTLNIRESVWHGIEELQRDYFKKEFDVDRVFKTFVVKLILFAAILDLNNKLPLKE